MVVNWFRSIAGSKSGGIRWAAGGPMVLGSKGRIAFVAVDLKQDPMCDLLNSYAKYKKDRDPDMRRPIGIELVAFRDERRWFLFCERCRARTFARRVPATNLSTSGTRRPGESAGFKSLDTGLPKRFGSCN